MTIWELSKLKDNPHNPRGVVAVDDSLLELAASITEQGILQPLLVTPDGTVVAGHRRRKAAELAGLSEVPALVRELSEAQQLQVMLVENMQRRDLDVVQQGKAFQRLQGFGLSLNQIHKALGVCIQTIKDRLNVASLAEECHPAFAGGQLPIGCAYALLDLPGQRQVYWVKRAVKEGWRGNELSDRIRGKRTAKERPATPEEVRREKMSTWVERLNRLDHEMDAYQLRTAQAAVRQAVNLIVDSMAERRKNEKAAT